MSSRFDRAYRVSGTTVVNADLWNRIMRDLDTRIVAVEEKKADFEEAEKTLLELALRRINETLLPAAQRIQAVSELGFLIASSDDELTVVPDQQASLRISEGAQRDLFTPSPFVALTRRSTIEDYAIARVVTYDRETGILVFDVESVTGNPGPHNDWDVVALAGAVMAQMATLDETKALRAEVADDKAAVAIDKAAAQSARTEAQNARDAAIIAKTDAESALASFMTVYRGALPSAPPDGEQGHFYFDTTLQMARVYTASGWEPLFQVSLGGIRQGFFEATNGQDEFTVAGGFSYLNVWVNGVLLAPGVDYTTASSDVTLAVPLSAGDQVAYTGYYATEVTDFYSKFDADARFVRYDDTQGLSGEQQAQARANINSASADDILTNFVHGLTLSNNSSDTNNDIDIAPGRARGSGVTVVISSTITKRLDANWTEGNGGGGLDTGSKAANATYHVFVIRKNDDGTGDVLLSASATSPTVPSGWTRVQRLGAILTDGSGNIRPFVQDGNRFMHNATIGVVDYSGTSVRALSPLTVTVPDGVRVEGIFRSYIVTADGDSMAVIDVGDGSNQNIRQYSSIYASTGVKSLTSTIKQFTNTTRQVWMSVTGNPHPSDACRLATHGWIDYQIPRIG